jgi:hypothetical protein
LPHANPLGQWEVLPWGGPNGGRTKDGETIPFQNVIGHSRTGEIIGCPYGWPGDRLWVRETCRAHELTDDEARNDTYKVTETMGLEEPLFGLDGVIYAADGAFRKIENSVEAAEKWGDLHNYRGKKGATVPGIHMPRWASRITLEITAVRVERLQDISEADAKTEGIVYEVRDPGLGKGGRPGWRWADNEYAGTAVHGYELLWEQINGPGSWAANPFVWCVSFKRI